MNRSNRSLRSPGGNGESTPTPIISGIALTDGQMEVIRRTGGNVLVDDAAKRGELTSEVISDAEVWLGWGLTPGLLEAASRLKWLQAAGAGVESYLFRELVDSAVRVTRIRGVHAGPVSEHAMGLMLAVARCLPRLVRQQADGVWVVPLPEEVASLEGSRILIIGTGEIGSAIAVRAAALGMLPEGVSRSGEARVEFIHVYRTDELLSATKHADWFVVACPLTSETRGLVSEAVLSAMPSEAALVNIARGAIVDQRALTKKLLSGAIRAAALDVFLEEPLPASDELWGLPNVMITPHAAGVMASGNQGKLAVASFVDNLARYRQGGALVGEIEKSKGY